MSKKHACSEFAVSSLEAVLFKKIVTGEWGPDFAVPTIDALCEEHHVGYHSVRAALGRLLSRGLLEFKSGVGLVVVDLLASADLEVLIEVARESPYAMRRWELLAQVLGFLRHNLSEMVDRAAVNRDDDQLLWFNHYLRVWADRLDLPGYGEHIRAAELQLLRVLASASGNIAFMMLVNGVRRLILSPPLEQESLLPLGIWERMRDAMGARNGPLAHGLMEGALWESESRCLDHLRNLGWKAQPTEDRPEDIKVIPGPPG